MKVDKQQLRDYVLGALPEAEQTAVEQTLLADRQQFDDAWALENELVDAYVRRALTADEQMRFERHYLASPRHRERVAIARQFLQEIDQTPAQVSQPETGWRAWLDAWRWPQLAFGGALATALLLLAGGALWLFNERSALQQQLAQAQQQAQGATRTTQAQQQALQDELAQARERNTQLNAELERLRQSSVETAPLLSFLLTAGATRNQNAAPTAVPQNQSKIQLLLPLTGDRYASYQAALQTVEGRTLLNASARTTKTFAALTLPAGTLRRGDYVVVLSGRNANGASEEVDRYFFRVP